MNISGILFQNNLSRENATSETNMTLLIKRRKTMKEPISELEQNLKELTRTLYQFWYFPVYFIIEKSTSATGEFSKTDPPPTDFTSFSKKKKEKKNLNKK